MTTAKSLMALRLYSKESQMFQSLHVCRICGKRFGTSKGVNGHQRVHSGKTKRVEDENEFKRIWGLKESRVSTFSTKEISIVTETLDLLRTGSSSLSFKESSFMTRIEQQEIKEAAMNLVLLSERDYDFSTIKTDDISMDLELKPMQEKIIHCVESKHDLRKLLSHYKSSTCSEIRLGDAVSTSLVPSYRCTICGKCFRTHQSLGGHQTLHRSVRMKISHSSLSGLSDSDGKKVVSRPSSFEVYQEELIQL